MLLPREANLCLRSSAHTFSGCCADQSGRCWSPFTCLPPLTLAFLELPRRNPALPSNSISRRFRSDSMPLLVVPSQIQSSAVRRCSLPFPLPSHPCFSIAVPFCVPRGSPVFPSRAMQTSAFPHHGGAIPFRRESLPPRRFAVRSKLILRKSNLFNATGVSTRLEPIPLLINADNSGSTLRCYVATLFRSIATHLFAGPILRVSSPFDQSKAVSGRLDSIQFRCWSLTCCSSPVLVCAVTMAALLAALPVRFIRPRTPPCSSA